MVRNFTFIAILFCIAFQSQGQTNPTAQSLPFHITFGTSTFTSMPTGTRSWNGLDGSNINTRALAESSTPGGNATINASNASTGSGGSYGHSTSSNGRLYIQSSSNNTDGVNQFVVAVNTGIETAITVSYNIELINAGNGSRVMGSVMQIRRGTSGSWTTVPNSAFIYGNSSSNDGDADVAGDVDTYSFSISGLLANTNYQVRFAHWRSGSGNSVGIAYDNVFIDAGTLPVRLADVKAFSKNAGNEVQWTNLTESDVVKYEVERSADGRSFTTLASLDPVGNYGNKQSYSWTDGAPFEGTSFYRVKAYELSGRILTSTVLKVSRNAAATGSVTIYPNPVTANQFTVQSAGISTGLYTLKIFNTRGQEIMHRFVKIESASYTQLIELPAGTPKGMYNLQLVNADTKLIRNFLIQ